MEDLSMGAELLTTREVEQLVQLNRVTIYRLIREEGFPALKLGGQWRFPKEEVQRWLADTERERTGGRSGALPLNLSDTKALFQSLEITSLLHAFSASLGLSILVVGRQGETLIDCPGCRHPFCAYVHATQQDHAICFAASDANGLSGEVLVDCASSLHYLQAPVLLHGEQIGAVRMGPLVTEVDASNALERELGDFAARVGASRDVLLAHFQSVRTFSRDQVAILADLVSRVVSTMLEMVASRADAVQRLNQIAELVGEA
jgi:excisionase family DNA binding protein